MRKLTIEELQRMDVAEFKQSEKLPLVVVLDNVPNVDHVDNLVDNVDKE